MNRRVDPDQLEAEADALLGIEPQVPAPLDTPPANPEGEPDEENEPTGTEPEPDESPAEEPEAPEPEVPAAEEDDLKGLTLKNAEERIRNAQKRMHTATQEAADLRKKQDGHAQELADKDVEIRRLQTELQQAKAAAQATPAPAAPVVTDASLQRLQEEYPDLAPVLTELTASRALNQQLAGKVDELKTRLDATDQKVDTRSERELISDHLTTIRKAHPDMDKIRDSDDFKGWKERQPPVVQDAISKGTALDVIWALDLYKEQVGLKKRKGKLGAAVTAAEPDVRTQRQPPAGSKRIFTQAEIDAMSPEEFEKNEAEIDKALAEGRVK